MASLLHDVMEDCGTSKAELIERFGAPVAELVDGLTKLDKLQFNSREENQSESFRKMLLAMARDVRVILIKLADRSHNMRTLSDVPRGKMAAHRIRNNRDLRPYCPSLGFEPDLPRTAGSGFPAFEALALQDFGQGSVQVSQSSA
jgi:guanosine-3',5'-bis(diphosphate) 3'-pyrophosphohydrolase